MATSRGPRLNPWERRPTDTDASWESFVVYRDMGVTRSLAKVGREVGKSTAQMEKWSRTHGWVLRAGAFDGEEDRQHVKWMREQRRKAEARNVRLAGTMLNSVVTGLHELDARKLKASDIARLTEVATKLEALAFGRPTENVAMVGGGDGKPSTGHINALGDEDRRARMLQLRRELDSRLDDGGQDDDEDGAA